MNKPKRTFPEVPVTETISDAVVELLEDRKTRETQEFKPFPLHALPASMSKFASEAALSLGCDPAYFIPAILASASTLIGNSRVIQLKPTWLEPGVIWIVLVAKSGTLKSPAQELALQPIYNLQQSAFKLHAHESAEYRAAIAEWKSKQREGEDPGKEPTAPICQRYYCSDITVEALAVLLEHQPRGLLLTRDELAGWLRSLDKYNTAKGSDVAQYLEMHRAKQLVVDRKSGSKQTIFVPRAFISITGGIQQKTLKEIMTPSLIENGFVPRILFVTPPTEKKSWSDVSMNQGALESYQLEMEKLLQLQMIQGADGIPAPQVLSLSPGAKETWVTFYNDHAEEQMSLEGGLASTWSKLEAYAARLAMIHQLVSESSLIVSEESMAAAVEMTRWFGHEAVRTYAALEGKEAPSFERKIVLLIAKKGGSVTANDLRRSSRQLETSDDARAVLNGLVAEGIGSWKHKGPTAAGGQPCELFTLHPSLLKKGQSQAADNSGVDFQSKEAI